MLCNTASFWGLFHNGIVFRNYRIKMLCITASFWGLFLSGIVFRNYKIKKKNVLSLNTKITLSMAKCGQCERYMRTETN